MNPFYMQIMHESIIFHHASTHGARCCVWCQDEASPEAPVPTITIVPALPRADASPSKLSRLQNMDVLEVTPGDTIRHPWTPRVMENGKNGKNGHVSERRYRMSKFGESLFRIMT